MTSIGPGRALRGFLCRGLLLFLLAFGVGVDLSDIFQNDLCHNREPQSCRLRDAGPRSRLSAPLYGRSPHCRTAGQGGNDPFMFLTAAIGWSSRRGWFRMTLSYHSAKAGTRLAGVRRADFVKRDSFMP